jgi:hypothetical protein
LQVANAAAAAALQAVQNAANMVISNAADAVTAAQQGAAMIQAGGGDYKYSLEAACYSEPEESFTCFVSCDAEDAK